MAELFDIAKFDSYKEDNTPLYNFFEIKDAAQGTFNV